MFWHLLPGPVIGGQANEAVLLIWDEWRAMKNPVRCKDWENVAESRAKRKGPTHEGIRIEAVLADFRGRHSLSEIPRWEAEHWVGFQIRSMHVELHEGCDLERTRRHARVFDAKIQIHYGICELGVR